MAHREDLLCLKMKVARELEVELRSATGLKSASKMAVYCVAWVEPSVRVPSPSTKAHGAHPEFNTSIVMALDERTLGRGQHLNIEILGQGLVSTRRVGFVRVSLSELLTDSADGAAVHTQFNAHPVTRHSGRQQGFLSFGLHIRPYDPQRKSSSKPAAVMTRRMTMEPTPSKPKVITTLRQRFEAESGDQSDDVMSPTSSSEEGHANNAASRKRLYALRPRSFSFNGCMSPNSQKPQ